MDYDEIVEKIMIAQKRCRFKRITIKRYENYASEKAFCKHDPSECEYRKLLQIENEMERQSRRKLDRGIR